MQEVETIGKLEIQRILIAAAIYVFEMEPYKAISVSGAWLHLPGNKPEIEDYNASRLWQLTLGFFCWHGKLDARRAARETVNFLDLWERIRLQILKEESIE